MKITEQLTDQALLTELGKRIMHLRTLRQFRQEDLAKRCGISRFALSRLENGDGGVRIEYFFAVLRQLGVLPRMESVLDEVRLTPIQEARLEASKSTFPKRVRIKKGKPAQARRTWGDGVEIER